MKFADGRPSLGVVFVKTPLLLSGLLPVLGGARKRRLRKIGGNHVQLRLGGAVNDYWSPALIKEA